MNWGRESVLGGKGFDWRWRKGLGFEEEFGVPAIERRFGAIWNAF